MGRRGESRKIACGHCAGGTAPFCDRSPSASIADRVSIEPTVPADRSSQSMASVSPVRVSTKRSASAGDIDGSDGAAAAKRARPAAGPLVVLVVTVSTDYEQQCFKVCVEARDDAEATPLERQCAGMRARGVRNALVRLGEEAEDLDGISDADVRDLVKHIRYCADADMYNMEVEEAIVNCAVVRDIPEGYVGRMTGNRHKTSRNEPAVVDVEMFADAHVVCLNLVEMPM